MLGLMGDSVDNIPGIPGILSTLSPCKPKNVNNLIDAEGVVEFRAHFERHGKPGIRAERSRFRREAGRWVYTDGED